MKYKLTKNNMTLTEQILKEFDELVQKTVLHKDENWATATEEDIKSFLLSALTRTREECANKVLETATYTNADINKALFDAASKIREMK